jgi:hypothetical protein
MSKTNLITIKELLLPSKLKLHIIHINNQQLKLSTMQPTTINTAAPKDNTENSDNIMVWGGWAWCTIA